MKPAKAREASVDRLEKGKSILEDSAWIQARYSGRLSSDLRKTLKYGAKPKRRVHDECIEEPEGERLLQELGKQPHRLFLICEKMDTRDDDLDKYEAEKDLFGERLHDRHVALAGPLEGLGDIVEVCHDGT